MRVLRRGCDGEDVERWQEFLTGQGCHAVNDGDFGPATEAATAAYQAKRGLRPDGVAGNRTFARAARDGFGLVDDPDAWPTCPDGVRPLNLTSRKELFGSFLFESAPTERNREAIKVHHGWAGENIVAVRVPFQEATKRCRVHRRIADQYQALWAAWEREGLLRHIETFNGSYVPRYIRGSRTRLSNHSWGTAFDINARFNRLGTVPAERGELGSVRELVELATDHGFYWGGWFRRRDGMHFEAFKVL